MQIDICVGMLHLDQWCVCMDMCTGMCMDMYMDMCMDMCTGMCMDMCMDMWMDMCIDVYRHMYRHVYTHVYGHASIFATVCRSLGFAASLWSAGDSMGHRSKVVVVWGFRGQGPHCLRRLASSGLGLSVQWPRP